MLDQSSDRIDSDGKAHTQIVRLKQYQFDRWEKQRAGPRLWINHLSRSLVYIEPTFAGSLCLNLKPRFQQLQIHLVQGTNKCIMLRKNWNKRTRVTQIFSWSVDLILVNRSAVD